MDEKYVSCFVQGRPVHNGDRFSKEHPCMPSGHRAKLFMPFDALDGYSEAIAQRQKITEPPPELTEDEKEALGCEFARLHEQWLAGEHLLVTVVFFQRDLRTEALRGDGSRGTFRETSGMLTRIDPDRRYLQVVEMKISFDCIYRLTSQKTAPPPAKGAAERSNDV